MNLKENTEQFIKNTETVSNKEWYLSNVLCETACPLNIRIEKIIDSLSKGDIEKSINLILKENPFPSITGRLCRYLCEESCIRKNLNSTVKIQEIEKYIGDYSLSNLESLNLSKLPSNGKNVLIIGAGLSGLSCAYYLTKAGFNITVYEKRQFAWGKLNYYPNFELEKEILDKELLKLEKLGVSIVYNKNIIKNDIENELINTYDVVLTTTGSDILREEHYEDINIIDAFELLSPNPTNDISKTFDNKRVVIIGINDFGLLAGRVVTRYKAKSVEMYFKDSKSKISSADKYLRKARQEGIRMNYFRKLKTINKNSQGIINKVEFIKTKNNLRGSELEEIENTEFLVETDKIIYADYKEETEEEQDKNKDEIGNIKHPKIFNFNNIPLYNKNALDVIVNAKELTERICKFTAVETDEKENDYTKVSDFERIENDAYKIESVKHKEISLAKRVLTFDPVSKTYTNEQIKKECQRCFRCSYQIKITNIEKCINCGICIDTCPTNVFGQRNILHPFVEKYTNNSSELLNTLIGMSSKHIEKYSSDSKPFINDVSKCVRCLKCVKSCPVNIIDVNRIVLNN